MINEEVYDRILNSLDDNEKTSIKEMNKNSFVKENELEQANPLEKQKSHTSHSNSDTKRARENDMTTEILDRLESIENKLGDSLQNRKYNQGIHNDIQDSYIENCHKDGIKRKISDEHDEIESKMMKFNRGTKRKNHFHCGNQQKKRKLCFDIWE